MSKSTQEKELEKLILRFFKENPIKFEPIAKKIGLSITAKSEGYIPVKFMYPLIQQIAKYRFAIGTYEFWSNEMNGKIIEIIAVDMVGIIYNGDIEYHEIESIEDVFKLMNYN